MRVEWNEREGLFGCCARESMILIEFESLREVSFDFFFYLFL